MSAKPTRKRSAMRDRTDWSRVRARTESKTRAAAVGDRDSFVPDKAWWARAKLVQPEAKRAISLRLDADVLEWFRRQGVGYQTRINAVLRSYVAAQGK